MHLAPSAAGSAAGRGCSRSAGRRRPDDHTIVSPGEVAEHRDDPDQRRADRRAHRRHQREAPISTASGTRSHAQDREDDEREEAVQCGDQERSTASSRSWCWVPRRAVRRSAGGADGRLLRSLPLVGRHDRRRARRDRDRVRRLPQADKIAWVILAVHLPGGSKFLLPAADPAPELSAIHSWCWSRCCSARHCSASSARWWRSPIAASIQILVKDPWTFRQESNTPPQPSSSLWRRLNRSRSHTPQSAVLFFCRLPSAD